MSMKWKQQVADRFDGAAEDYDHHSDIQRLAAKQLGALLPDVLQPRILEIGCGTGSLTRELFKKYPDGVFEITDISPRMVAQNLENAEGNHGNVNWSIMDGENPSCKGTFDLIVSNMTLQWFETPEDSLENLRQYLKPNGNIFYTVPGPQSFREWKNALIALDLPSGILDFSTWPGIIKEEERQAQYDGALDFLKRMKAIGAGTSRRGYKPLGYADMKRACKQFDQEFKGYVSWQILYGCLTKS